MKHSIYGFVLAALLLASCVSSKKYQSANLQIDQLNNQVSQLNSKIADNQKQISDNSKLITELQKANEVNSKDAADCRAVKEELRRKKENLDKALAARGTSLEEIEAKAEAAVKKFEDIGCEVSYKNGRFHISIPDNFSFKSGSATVAPKGREALNIVAQVMYDNPGVQTMIVGHSDTTVVKGGGDNWSLSTERANAIVRVLEDVYNINPKRLTAAGQSKFNPVASNDTPEGRAKNRRIEIIINPDLSRLWDMMEE